MRLPVYPSPSYSRDEENVLLKARLAIFKGKDKLLDNFVETTALKQEYDQYVLEKKTEVQAIRRKYVKRLFYSSSLAQNGALDALLIFAAAVNICRDTFKIYNGRASLRDMAHIAKHIYYSVAIGGSEISEYAVEELFSKLVFDGAQGIPYVDRILSSFADGFVNAAMLTRISMITENYCSTTVIDVKKDLYPSPVEIARELKLVSSDVFDDLKGSLAKLAKEKTKNSLSYFINPLKLLKKKNKS